MPFPATIDSKTDTHNWWVEKTSVTISLVQLSATDPKFGLSYSASWSGAKSGSTSGGPSPITGNGATVVNQNPQVTLAVSDYNDTGSSISLHVVLTVDAGGVIGTKTVFDESLGGHYPPADFAGLVASMQAAHAAAQ